MLRSANRVGTTLTIVISSCIAGCCTDPKVTQQPEDPEVLARCTPVRDLLSKNYHRQNNVDLAVVNAGSLYKTEGAVLSGEEAAHIADIDIACRAWVHHIISGEDYAKKVLGITSATIVSTSAPGERHQIIESAIKILSDFKRQGLLPNELNPLNLSSKVEDDAKLTKKQLEDELAAAMTELAEQIHKYPKNEIIRQEQILTRIAQLERTLSEFEKPHLPPLVTPPQGSTPLEVYFTTMNAELTYDAITRLRSAAETWRGQHKIVDITGYADPRGNLLNNMKLARVRAENVAAILKRLGVTLGDVKGEGIGTGSLDNDQLRVVRIVPK